MSDELKPCPFCGQQDAFVEQLDSDASVVICQGMVDEHSACLARGPVGVQQSDLEDQPGRDAAIAEWNRRAQPAEAEGVDFGFDDRSVKVSQEAYSIFLEREQHHLAALSAVTSERDSARTDLATVIGQRDCYANQVLRLETTVTAERDQLRAEVEMLRKDAERWRYVSLQGDDTHWLNLLRVDLEDFGGNINAAVDALIDGEAPAMAAKEA